MWKLLFVSLFFFNIVLGGTPQNIFTASTTPEWSNCNSITLGSQYVDDCTFTSGSTASVRWGVGLNGGPRSGLVFSGVSNIIFEANGPEVALGTLTHENFKLNGVDGNQFKIPDQVDLEIELCLEGQGCEQFSYTLQMDETLNQNDFSKMIDDFCEYDCPSSVPPQDCSTLYPNSVFYQVPPFSGWDNSLACCPYPSYANQVCSDKLDFESVVPQSGVTFTIGAFEYSLEITGFKEGGLAITNVFISQENEANSRTLFGRLTAICAQSSECPNPSVCSTPTCDGSTCTLIPDNDGASCSGELTGITFDSECAFEECTGSEALCQLINQNQGGVCTPSNPDTDNGCFEYICSGKDCIKNNFISGTNCPAPSGQGGLENDCQEFRCNGNGQCILKNVHQNEICATGKNGAESEPGNGVFDPNIECNQLVCKNGNCVYRGISSQLNQPCDARGDVSGDLCRQALCINAAGVYSCNLVSDNVNTECDDREDFDCTRYRCKARSNPSIGGTCSIYFKSGDCTNPAITPPECKKNICTGEAGNADCQPEGNVGGSCTSPINSFPSNGDTGCLGRTCSSGICDWRVKNNNVFDVCDNAPSVARDPDWVDDCSGTQCNSGTCRRANRNNGNICTGYTGPSIHPTCDRTICSSGECVRNFVSGSCAYTGTPDGNPECQYPTCVDTGLTGTCSIRDRSTSTSCTNLDGTDSMDPSCQNKKCDGAGLCIEISKTNSACNEIPAFDSDVCTRRRCSALGQCEYNLDSPGEGNACDPSGTTSPTTCQKYSCQQNSSLLSCQADPVDTNIICSSSTSCSDYYCAEDINNNNIGDCFQFLSEGRLGRDCDPSETSINERDRECYTFTCGSDGDCEATYSGTSFTRCALEENTGDACRSYFCNDTTELCSITLQDIEEDDFCLDQNINCNPATDPDCNIECLAYKCKNSPSGLKCLPTFAVDGAECLYPTIASFKRSNNIKRGDGDGSDGSGDGDGDGDGDFDGDFDGSDGSDGDGGDGDGDAECLIGRCTGGICLGGLKEDGTVCGDGCGGCIGGFCVDGQRDCYTFLTNVDECDALVCIDGECLETGAVTSCDCLNTCEKCTGDKESWPTNINCAWCNDQCITVPEGSGLEDYLEANPKTCVSNIDKCSNSGNDGDDTAIYAGTAAGAVAVLTALFCILLLVLLAFPIGILLALFLAKQAAGIVSINAINIEMDENVGAAASPLYDGVIMDGDNPLFE